jgi:hypothetical protein
MSNYIQDYEDISPNNHFKTEDNFFISPKNVHFFDSNKKNYKKFSENGLYFSQDNTSYVSSDNKSEILMIPRVNNNFLFTSENLNSSNKSVKGINNLIINSNQKSKKNVNKGYLSKNKGIEIIQIYEPPELELHPIQENDTDEILIKRNPPKHYRKKIIYQLENDEENILEKKNVNESNCVNSENKNKNDTELRNSFNVSSRIYNINKKEDARGDNDLNGGGDKLKPNVEKNQNELGIRLINRSKIKKDNINKDRNKDSSQNNENLMENMSFGVSQAVTESNTEQVSKTKVYDKKRIKSINLKLSTKNKEEEIIKKNETQPDIKNNIGVKKIKIYTKRSSQMEDNLQDKKEKNDIINNKPNEQKNAMEKQHSYLNVINSNNKNNKQDNQENKTSQNYNSYQKNKNQKEDINEQSDNKCSNLYVRTKICSSNNILKVDEESLNISKSNRRKEKEKFASPVNKNMKDNISNNNIQENKYNSSFSLEKKIDNIKFSKVIHNIPNTKKEEINLKYNINNNKVIQENPSKKSKLSLNNSLVHTNINISKNEINNLKASQKNANILPNNYNDKTNKYEEMKNNANEGKQGKKLFTNYKDNMTKNLDNQNMNTNKTERETKKIEKETLNTLINETGKHYPNNHKYLAIKTSNLRKKNHHKNSIILDNVDILKNNSEINKELIENNFPSINNNIKKKAQEEIFDNEKKINEANTIKTPFSDNCVDIKYSYKELKIKRKNVTNQINNHSMKISYGLKTVKIPNDKIMNENIVLNGCKINEINCMTNYNNSKFEINTLNKELCNDKNNILKSMFNFDHQGRNNQSKNNHSLYVSKALKK